MICLSFLGLSLKWFYDVMVSGPEAAEAKKREAKEARKAKKDKRKLN